MSRRAGSSSRPIAAILPSLTPTSAVRGAAPVPSIKVPPRMRRSNMTRLLIREKPTAPESGKATPEDAGCHGALRAPFRTC